MHGITEGPSFMAGMLIHEVPDMVDWHEDWSQVRSPSRAARRLKRGFPQRIRRWSTPMKSALALGNKLFMHPVMARELRDRIARGDQ